jgi:tetraacyldisaccharide 4'-kinase
MPLNQETYKKIISGQKKGALTLLLRLALGLIAFFYCLVIEIRNILYDKEILKSHHVKAIVISIGNLTTGGTGKTPLVVWLASTIEQKAKSKKQKCGIAILTRGYKTRTPNPEPRATSNEPRATTIDEPAILSQACPQVKVIINPDRVAGASEAIDKYGAKVLIMDDGFQHRRLARDLDIVTIDATLPFGYGKIFPAGFLREPVTSLKRADAVVLTRCDQVDTIELDKLEQTIRQINPDMAIARSLHAPVCVKTIQNQISLEKLRGQRVFAFCGIGNPDAFLKTIKNLGCELVGSKIYDDHHHYNKSDITDIYIQADSLKADMILTTQKDWTSARYEIKDMKYEKFAYIVIEITFQTGIDKLTDLIEKTLAGTI